MKKLCFWAIIALPVVAISCKKDEETTTPTEKFISLTAGSSWNYQLGDSASVPPTVNTYMLTASAQDTTINAKIYKIFTSTGTANEYYNISGNDYYTYRKLPTALGGGYLEVLYLKSDLNTGGTWSQTSPISVTISGFPLTLSLTFNNTVTQKGITKVVNGVTYTNVTEVTSTLGVTGIPIANTLTSDIHYFYAPNVGQIQNNTKLNLTVTGYPPTSFNTQTILLSSHIL